MAWHEATTPEERKLLFQTEGLQLPDDAFLAQGEHSQICQEPRCTRDKGHECEVHVSAYAFAYGGPVHLHQMKRFDNVLDIWVSRVKK